MKWFLLSVIMLGSVLMLRAQNGYWEEAKGPYGGDFDLTKTNDGTLYATFFEDLKRVYRSTDDGKNWEHLSFLQKAFPHHSYNRLVVGAKGTLFVGVYDADTGGTNWYKTNNDGQSWEPFNVFSLFLERPSGVLFGVPWNGSPVRSVDGGQNWEPASLVIDHLYYPVNDPYGGLILLPSHGENLPVFQSHDDGLSWDTIQVPFDFFDYFFTPSGTFFAVKADSPNEIFRTSDGGVNFVSIGISAQNFVNASFSCLLNGRILLESDTTVYYSDDDGESWQVLLHPDKSLGDWGNFQSITPLPDGKIFKNYLGSLLSSTDGGLSWEFSGSGMRNAEVNELRFVSDSLFYSYTPIGAWRTEDAGETWRQLSKNLVFAKPGNNIQITNTGGVVLIQDHQLLWSANGKDNFLDITPADSLLDYGNTIYCNPINNDLFTRTKSGLQRSQDLGQHWEWVFNALPQSRLYFHSTGRLFLTNTISGVYYSDDNGTSWHNLTIPNIFLNEFKRAPNGDIYASGSNGASNHLWKSIDAGLTWEMLPVLINELYWDTRFFEIAQNGHLFLQNGDTSFIFTTNNCLSWQTLPSLARISDYWSRNCLVLSPDQHLYVGGPNEGGLYRTSSPVTEGAYIEGHAKIDADADCSTPDAQEPLKNWNVEAQGVPYTSYTKTDADGHYIFFVDTGTYQVTLQNPNSVWWTFCDTSQTANLPNLSATDTIDFAAIPLSFCPLLTVNVGIPQLRRCFDNEVYVEYCNQGTEPADSAWVDVMLDPYLSFVSSAQPNLVLPYNTIRFFVGDIPSGECGQFQLTIHVDCDSTILGQTHCVTAHGFPDTLCTNVPNWSGANIEATVSCQDSTLQFNLKNTGNAHSQTLDYIIIEDDVVLMTGQQDYDVAEDLVLNVSANGSTWRVESAQEPGHPFSNLALAFAEGCGGFGSLGYINQFPVNGIQPSWHRMCVENTGSYDPNDKQGFPIGVGTEHNIRPGQTIDYLIRFQNTGTDTAFTVLIRDTLSTFHDPINIRPGASSHPYTWDLSGQGVIQFMFNNIMLPDSNVNEATSHGFVQFSIAPYVDVPLGSVIQNNAAIYFDFNLPVITNTTWHTIEKSPLISATHPVPSIVESELEVWPNPFSERTNIHVQKATRGKLTLSVFNSLGNLVVQKAVIGPDIEMNTKNLPKGLYWAEIRNLQGEIVGSVKLLRQ